VISRHAGRPGEKLERLGDEIVVCGQLFHTGAPVVLWTDPGGYDAYRAEPRFAAPGAPVDEDGPEGQRYGTMRRDLPLAIEAKVRERGWDVETLAEQVDLFVLHYDAAGTSRRCFQVLHDQRGLSVHFMLDLDGTIYQTLDVKERAWHAGTANDRSIGIEIASIGAYPDTSTLDRWYARDPDGHARITLPPALGDGGIRTAGFVGRPARDEPVRGRIQETDLIQYDFTAAQYRSLSCLAATLSRVLPRIRLDAPRDAEGRVIPSVLSDQELSGTSGIVGHYHTSAQKIDPGPAFDWDRFLATARRRLQPVAPR
jgi:N-acetyl-anhydromuramyl-L-alanine amidase AmpD